MNLNSILALLDKEIEALKAVSNDVESFFVRAERQTVKQETESTSCPTSPKQEDEEELVVSCIDKALQKAAETWSEVSAKQPIKPTEQSRVPDSNKLPQNAISKPKPVVSGKAVKAETNLKPAINKPVQPAKAKPAVSQNIGAKPKRYVPAHQKAPFKTFSEPVKGNHKFSHVSTARNATNEKTEDSPDALTPSKSNQEPEKPVPKPKDKDRSPPRPSSSASTSTVNLTATQQQDKEVVVTPRSRMRSWLSERELPESARAHAEKQFGERSLKTVNKEESTSETNLKGTSKDPSSLKDGAEKGSETKRTPTQDQCTEESTSELPILVQRGDFVRDFLNDAANSRSEHRLHRAANDLFAARKHCFEKMALDDNSTRVSNTAKAKFIAQVDAKLSSKSKELLNSDAQRIATAASMCQEFDQLAKLLCSLPQDLNCDKRAGPKSDGASTQKNNDDFQAIAYSRRVIERVLERAVQLERPYRELLAQNAAQSRGQIDTRSAFETCANKSRRDDRRCSRIVVYASARELARLSDLRCAVLAARIRLHLIDTHARSLVDAFQSALVKGEASERATLIRTYRALFRLVAHESPVVVLGQPGS